MVTFPGCRVVLVTGASSGIGRECALAFARRGDTVVGVARHAPALQELAAAHPGIHVETCDVTDAAERAALVKRVLAAHGRIDVLVNNAGVGALGYLDETRAPTTSSGCTATNVVAVADLTRLVLPGMRARGDGAVVMISSVAAWASVPPATVYSSSKFAVHGPGRGPAPGAAGQRRAGALGQPGADRDRLPRPRGGPLAAARRPGPPEAARVPAVVGRGRGARRGGRRPADDALGAPAGRAGAARARAAGGSAARRGVRPVRSGDHRPGQAWSGSRRRACPRADRVDGAHDAQLTYQNAQLRTERRTRACSGCDVNPVDEARSST